MISASMVYIELGRWVVQGPLTTGDPPLDVGSPVQPRALFRKDFYSSKLLTPTFSTGVFTQCRLHVVPSILTDS